MEQVTHEEQLIHRPKRYGEAKGITARCIKHISRGYNLAPCYGAAMMVVVTSSHLAGSWQGMARQGGLKGAHNIMIYFYYSG